VCRVKSAAEARERFVAPRRWQKEQLQRVAERVPEALRETWAV
jgi:hypothetical protein